MVRNIYFLCALLLIGCQTDLSNKNEVVKGNSDLKISDGVLDLSQFSQEQQKFESKIAETKVKKKFIKKKNYKKKFYKKTK